MGNGILLLIVLSITTSIGIAIQVVLYKSRKKQKVEYPELWKKFNDSKDRKLYKDTIHFGNKLIFNTQLTPEHLKKIHQTAIDLEKNYHQFNELKLNAFNKQLHFDRPISRSVEL